MRRLTGSTIRRRSAGTTFLHSRIKGPAKPSCSNGADVQLAAIRERGSAQQLPVQVDGIRDLSSHVKPLFDQLSTLRSKTILELRISKKAVKRVGESNRIIRWNEYPRFAVHHNLRRATDRGCDNCTRRSKRLYGYK